MRKVIKIQTIKMVVIYALLVGLVVWQEHFVVSGIISNVYLNGLIIGVFIFGSFLAFRQIIGLRQEVAALDALKEAFADTRERADRAAVDPYWRHYRCLKPGIVYHKPHLLGHFFELTLDEIIRSGTLNVSIDTLQNIVHGIEMRISEERSFVNYLNGLLVFLGLIGTFIGLMEMVGSVGGIIGGLNNMSGGAESFKRLLHDLEAPLKGMALGFSSSLFGLFTSLVLGLTSRFGVAAALDVKANFEAWLASAAKLGSEANAEKEAEGLAHASPAPKEHAEKARPAARGEAVTAHQNVALAGIMASADRHLKQIVDETVGAREAQSNANLLLTQTVAGLEQLAARVGSLDERLVAEQQQRTQLSLTLKALEAAMQAGFQSSVTAVEVARKTSIDIARELAARQADGTAKLLAVGGRAATSDDIRNLANAVVERLASLPQQAGPSTADPATAMPGASLDTLARVMEDSIARGFQTALTMMAPAEPEEEAEPEAPVAVEPTQVGPVGAPAEEPVFIDHDLMVRRLYEAVSQQMRPATDVSKSKAS